LHGLGLKLEFGFASFLGHFKQNSGCLGLALALGLGLRIKRQISAAFLLGAWRSLSSNKLERKFIMWNIGERKPIFLFLYYHSS